MHKSIFIIIATYNGMKWLERCLASTAPYPVIVVDNGSTDGTIDFIKKNHPVITVLQQDKNLGFGAANNLGMQYALENGADGVFLLNQDAYLKPYTIKILSDFSSDHPEYGLLSPLHLNGQGDYLDRKFTHYMSYDNNKDFYSDAVLRGFKACYNVPFVNAAAWFLPKKTLEEIGGFDPIFFHYGEDDNYCQRLLFHKKEIGVLPKSRILHDREHRQNPSIKVEHNDFREIEKSFKLKWANINITFRQNKKELIKKQTLKAIKLFAKGRLKAGKKHFEIYQLQRDWSKSIEQSRAINKTKGCHYL